MLSILRYPLSVAGLVSHRCRSGLSPLQVWSHSVAGLVSFRCRSGFSPSQVWSLTVAGLCFLSELRRESCPKAKNSRRSFLFRRPATLHHLTCDTSPSHLRHFAISPATKLGYMRPLAVLRHCGQSVARVWTECSQSVARL